MPCSCLFDDLPVLLPSLPNEPTGHVPISGSHSVQVLNSQFRKRNGWLFKSRALVLLQTQIGSRFSRWRCGGLNLLAIGFLRLPDFCLFFYFVLFWDEKFSPDNKYMLMMLCKFCCVDR